MRESSATVAAPRRGQLSFRRFLRRLGQVPPDTQEGATVLPSTLSETIQALNPRAVHGLSESILTTVPFLQTMEEAQIPGLSLRYCMVHDEFGPAGFLALSVVSLEGSQVDAKHPGTEQKILLGGHPLVWGSQFCSFRDPEPAPTVMASLAGAVYRIRKLEGISASLLNNFTEDDLARLKVCEEYGYVRFPSPRGAHLAIEPEWRSFSDYMESLPVRGRKTAREERRAFEKAGLAVETARPTPLAAELCELYARSPSSNPCISSFRQSIGLTPAFFCAAEQYLRDEFRLAVVRKDGRLAAFLAAIEDRGGQRGANRLLVLLAGAENQLDAEHHLRANLLHWLVEEAIRGEFAGLEADPDATGLDASRGAAIQPLYCLIRHQKPAADLLTRIIYECLIDPQGPCPRKAKPS
ncbi:MAG: N-acetyltransferase [Planctomycetes bacterium]|nr:N-acetyltransferase [Planctomycetota bacterium]